MSTTQVADYAEVWIVIRRGGVEQGAIDAGTLLAAVDHLACTGYVPLFDGLWSRISDRTVAEVRCYV
jgi:hypothetical protein